MKKNRLTSAKILVDIINDPKSGAYADLCAMSTDRHGLQSDKPGAALRNEIEKTLKDLLGGRRLEEIAKTINRYTTTRPPRLRLRHIETRKNDPSPDFYAITKKVPLGDRQGWVDILTPVDATPRQIIYGILRRSLESGEIAGLALCRVCEKIFYRKSLKGVFCRATCRWRNHRRSEQRKKKRRKGGEWYR